MNTEIYKLSDVIKQEFTGDISKHETDHIALTRWNNTFTELESANKVSDVSYAADNLFQWGARYIRDDNRYNYFRSIYHQLFDEIQKLNNTDHG